MNTAIWIHQLDTAYPGLVGPDDGQMPFAEVWVKTIDSLSWMGNFDSHPAAVSGIAALKSLRQVYAQQGIVLRPWGVVAGRRENGTVAPDEGQLAGQITTASGQRAFIVDLEPHYHGGATPQFWRDDLGASGEDVGLFVSAFRTAAPEGELWVAPDAREPHLGPVSFASWVASPHVTRCLPQVYWTDFGVGWRAAIDSAIDTLARWGWTTRASIHPILPGNAEPEDMVQAIRYLAAIGCGGYSVWQRANLREDTMQAIRAPSDPWGEEAAPPALTDADRLIDQIHALTSAALAARGA